MADIRVKTVTYSDDGNLEMEIENFMDRYNDHRLVTVSVTSAPYLDRDGVAVIVLEKGE